MHACVEDLLEATTLCDITPALPHSMRKCARICMHAHMDTTAGAPREQPILGA